MKLISLSQQTQHLKLVVRAKIPRMVSTDEPTLIVDDYMDSDNTMAEYNSNDMFGDLLWVTYHRYLCYEIYIII
jgi:ABC-type molybdenum transport system ATPase subunit/photorepair protein PhrA